LGGTAALQVSGQEQFFVSGPLTDPDLCAIVLGADAQGQPALLDGYCDALDDQGAPCLMACATRQVAGLLVRPTPEGAARLDLYQTIFAQVRTGAHLPDGRRVQVYCPQAPTTQAAPFDLAHWQQVHGPATRRAAQAILTLAHTLAPEVLRVRYPMALAHASAQMRAAAEPVVQTTRRAAQAGDVVSRQQMTPYAYFFGVQVDDLQFRRFDGSLSPVVRRAGFLMADAVTVLPYDPQRDCVMLVEQFRYGVYLRGAANAWMLEPVAGRIDGAEAPEAAALREMREEARLDLRESDLRAIGTSYPSPGAVTEFIFHFIALCDLPDTAEGVGGLVSEAEDIRAHIVPFDRLMQMVQTGEAQNGPLIHAAYWLALNRASLRAQ
jgi:ADP-ribose pyrophosphatase